MLLFLISVGRFMVALGGIITIVSGIVVGWVFGASLDQSQFGFLSSSSVTPNRLIFAAIGLTIGAVLAGTIFGLVAAVFDIQRLLRTLVDDQFSRADLNVERRRVEPTLAG